MEKWFFYYLLGIQQVFARGGGGGSHSGGGGGSFGGGYHGGSGVSGGTTSDPLGTIISFLVVVGFLVLFNIFSQKVKKGFSRSFKNQKALTAQDFPEDPLKQRVAEVFYAFQEAWSTYQVDKMKEYLTADYYNRMDLELNVLYSLHRQDLVKNPRLLQVVINGGEVEGNPANFTATIWAVADDTLMDTTTNQPLFTDSSAFTEYWHFTQVEGVWRLNLISQDTEATSKVSNQIREFAESNGFYFDPDFGWLMLPQKGAIFANAHFHYSDVNNHVIGLYRGKIVEFYSYNPDASHSLEEAGYLVAQVVVPSQYRDILVTRKGFWNRPPRGMVARTLESPDFNAKFSLFADPLDQYSGWLLLSPTFMEKMSSLEFVLNIEVVGNIIYFYTKDFRVEYGQMLEILSWAFDELK